MQERTARLSLVMYGVLLCVQIGNAALFPGRAFVAFMGSWLCIAGVTIILCVELGMTGEGWRNRLLRAGMLAGLLVAVLNGKWLFVGYFGRVDVPALENRLYTFWLDGADFLTAGSGIVLARTLPPLLNDYIFVRPSERPRPRR